MRFHASLPRLQVAQNSADARSRLQNSRPHPASGSVSIEFAFIFVLLIALFYGTAGFVTPLLLSISYQDVAATSLREAVMLRYAPLPDLEPSEAKAAAKDAVERSWLPQEWAEPCDGYGTDYLNIEGDIWKGCVRHPNPSALFPQIYIPIVNARIPPLPEELKGEAMLQLPPYLRFE